MDTKFEIARELERKGYDCLAHELLVLAADLPELSPQLKETLLKIRKKSAGSFNAKKWNEVFDAFGWKVRKGTGLEDVYDFRPRASDLTNPAYNKDIKYKAAKTNDWNKYLDWIRKQKVSSPPKNPKKGQLYVSEFEEFSGDSWNPEPWYKVHGWIGIDGFYVTTDSGKEFFYSPATHIRGLERFVYQNGGIDKALALLGMGEHIPGAQRTRENTGTCPICLRNIKLKKAGAQQTMVNHGFTRPRNWGYQVGNCFGVGHQPYELSDEGCKAFLHGVLLPTEKKLNEQLANLKRPDLDSLTVQFRSGKTKTITPIHPEWKRALTTKILNIEAQLSALASDTKMYQNLIKTWKPEPLPEVGGMERRFDLWEKMRK